MYTLAWLTSVNQLIPVIVDKKRAKEVAPQLAIGPPIGHWPIGGLCVSVMPPQGTLCRATPDRNGRKARHALRLKRYFPTSIQPIRQYRPYSTHRQAHPHPHAHPSRFWPAHPIYLLDDNSKPGPLQPGLATGAANRNLGHFPG